MTMTIGLPTPRSLADDPIKRHGSTEPIRVSTYRASHYTRADGSVVHLSSMRYVDACEACDYRYAFEDRDAALTQGRVPPARRPRRRAGDTVSAETDVRAHVFVPARPPDEASCAHKEDDGWLCSRPLADHRHPYVGQQPKPKPPSGTLRDWRSGNASRRPPAWCSCGSGWSSARGAPCCSCSCGPASRSGCCRERAAPVDVCVPRAQLVGRGHRRCAAAAMRRRHSTATRRDRV